MTAAGGGLAFFTYSTNSFNLHDEKMPNAALKKEKPTRKRKRYRYTFFAKKITPRHRSVISRRKMKITHIVFRHTSRASIIAENKKREGKIVFLLLLRVQIVNK